MSFQQNTTIQREKDGSLDQTGELRKKQWKTPSNRCSNIIRACLDLDCSLLEGVRSCWLLQPF